MTDRCPSCGALRAGRGGSPGIHAPACTDPARFDEAIARVEVRVDRLERLLSSLAAADPPTDRDDEDGDQSETPGAGAPSLGGTDVHHAADLTYPPEFSFHEES